MTDPAGTCLNPAEIEAGDLIAFAEGEAGPAVADHVRRCPACRAAATAYRALQGDLQSVFLRRSCPPAHRLAEYVLAVLDPEDARGVAAHLSECPHCRAEQRDAAAFLRDDTPEPQHGLIPAIRRLLALPLRPAPLTAGLRGAGEQESVTYEADELRLTVSVQRSERGNSFMIAGLLEDWEQFAGAAVRLLRDEQVQYTDTVDDLGSFTFERVQAGSYRLEVESSSTLLAVEPLVAGAA